MRWTECRWRCWGRKPPWGVFYYFLFYFFLNHTVCWWSCMTPHSAAALIEYWQGKLSSVSCSVYIIPPSCHIIDSVEASGAAWCLSHAGDRRDFWSLIVRDTKAREALLEQWGQSSCFLFFFSPPRTPPATNTQRCVQQTYKKKKNRCEGGATAGAMTC